MSNINHVKLFNELKNFGYNITEGYLNDICKELYITKTEHQIKHISVILKTELKKIKIKVKQNHLIESISRSQFDTNWHILKNKLEPWMQRYFTIFLRFGQQAKTNSCNWLLFYLD